MPWRDRLIGVALGLALGIGVVVLFVFVYSERTVDAPSISRGAASGGQGRHGQGRGSQAPGGRRAPVAMVRVVGGAPPPSGPPAFHYRKGEEIRLRVASDETLRLELLGYGVGLTAPAGQTVTRRIEATKGGNFPLVVATSHIDVARITVGVPPA